MKTSDNPKSCGRRYPWTEWFAAWKAAGELVLARDADFNGRPDSFGLLVRARAKQRGLRVGVSISPDGGTVTLGRARRYQRRTDRAA